eukprot:1956212-Rhodomonas_salina.1
MGVPARSFCHCRGVPRRSRLVAAAHQYRPSPSARERSGTSAGVFPAPSTIRSVSTGDRIGRAWDHTLCEYRTVLVCMRRERAAAVVGREGG